jgi:hypothetical protein
MFDVCEEGTILAAGMLRLIQLGCLSTVETREVSFMGKTKEKVTLRLMGSRHDHMNEYDEYLYTVLEGAADLCHAVWIADQVAEQMKELYPELSLELADYSQSMFTAYSYHHLSLTILCKH